MTKICYLLLCHKNPEDVIEQVSYLKKSGGYVVVHIDLNATKATHKRIREYFAADPNVGFVNSVKAGWGDWSLVEATLRMIRLALDRFPDASNFYYLSGDCIPIQSHNDLISFLEKSNSDIIETADFYTGNWIKTGPHLERIEFFHFINERKYKKLFYIIYRLHRLFGIKRTAPAGLVMSIGSQWWCLKRQTLERMLIFLASRPEIEKFFKRCWIPDEMFFQTIVATLTSEESRRNSPPTFLRFSDYGMPTVFYNDHYDFLISQDNFFARKISPNARHLKQRLIKRFIGPSDDSSKITTGKEFIGFTAYAGRQGVRHNSRTWERGGRLPNNTQLYIIVSKKWHVGKRFGMKLSEVTGIPFFGYIFDENSPELGALGGFEDNHEYRLQSPVAFINVLYRTKALNQAIIGIDSSRAHELRQLAQSHSGIRVIELENEFSPEYLNGHAQRAGIISQESIHLPLAESLRNTILQTFKKESEQIQSIDFERFKKISSWQAPNARAEILSNIFDQPADNFLTKIGTLALND